MPRQLQDGRKHSFYFTRAGYASSISDGAVRLRELWGGIVVLRLSRSDTIKVTIVRGGWYFGPQAVTAAIGAMWRWWWGATLVSRWF